MRANVFLGAVTALGLVFAASGSQATVLIDGSTLGFYNDGLGDLAPSLGSQTDGATGASLFPAANISGGDPTIGPIATEPDLSTVTELGNFLSDPTALGGSWSASPQAIPNTWTVNEETAIVYTIDAGPSGLVDVTIDLGVDNGIFIWLDGGYLFGALAPGGASLSEYHIDVASLSGGLHYLQILREDHGGLTGYAILAQGTAVPEPGTLALLGAGLAGLGLVGRRRRRTA